MSSDGKSNKGSNDPEFWVDDKNGLRRLGGPIGVTGTGESIGANKNLSFGKDVKPGEDITGLSERELYGPWSNFDLGMVKNMQDLHADTLDDDSGNISAKETPCKKPEDIKSLQDKVYISGCSDGQLANRDPDLFYAIHGKDGEEAHLVCPQGQEGQEQTFGDWCAANVQVQEGYYGDCAKKSVELSEHSTRCTPEYGKYINKCLELDNKGRKEGEKLTMCEPLNKRVQGYFDGRLDDMFQEVEKVYDTVWDLAEEEERLERGGSISAKAIGTFGSDY